MLQQYTVICYIISCIKKNFKDGFVNLFLICDYSLCLSLNLIIAFCYIHS